MYLDSHDITSLAVAVIGGFFALTAIVLAFVLPLLRDIRRHARTAAYEVSNDHKTNLRVENDERHEENKKAIASLRNLVVATNRTTSRRFARIEDHMGIEHTLPAPIRRKKKR